MESVCKVELLPHCEDQVAPLPVFLLGAPHPPLVVPRPGSSVAPKGLAESHLPSDSSMAALGGAPTLTPHPQALGDRGWREDRPRLTSSSRPWGHQGPSTLRAAGPWGVCKELWVPGEGGGQGSGVGELHRGGLGTSVPPVPRSTARCSKPSYFVCKTQEAAEGGCWWGGCSGETGTRAGPRGCRLRLGAAPGSRHTPLTLWRLLAGSC